MHTLAITKRLPRAMRLLGILLFCFGPLEAPAQEANPNPVRDAHDKSDRVVYWSYFGSSGIRSSAPKNAERLERIVIPYHTTLTADDVSFLSSLENVEELWIGGNLNDEFVTFEGSLTPLGKIKRLRYVFLCKRDMRDEDLAFVANLPEIEYLEFLADTNPPGEAGPVVTDDSARFLRRATTLRELRIDGGDKLTDQFVSVISRDLQSLEHLDIHSDELTDRSLLMLANRSTNLRQLRISSNRFTDKGVAHLANAKSLEELWLASNSLTHNCITSVSNLIGLRVLELTVPTIEDDGVQILAGLPKLERLVLRQPPLTDEQFAMFLDHLTLESAFLNGRDLSEAKVISVIRTIRKLHHLDVGQGNKTLQIAIDKFLAGRRSASIQPEDSG